MSTQTRTHEFLAELKAIHPEIAKWALEKIQEGWTVLQCKNSLAQIVAQFGR